MWQDIFVGIIIGATVINVIYNIIRSVKKKKSCSCDACAGCALKTNMGDVRFRTPPVSKAFTNG